MCFFMKEDTMKNNKNILKILIAAVVCVLLVVFVYQFTKPKTVEGKKEVTLIVVVHSEDGDETVATEKVNTDAETLGELLVEVDKNGVLAVKLDGSATDQYGRTLVAIGEYETLDWTTGPWWLYNSTTNETCVSAGYCSGIDQTPIYNGDIFEFIFTDSFE